MATPDTLAWRTSSYTDKGQACVEVAPTSDAVLVRDTKDRGAGPILRFGHRDWAEFLTDPAATEADRVTEHAGRPVATRWHLRDTLHFTTAEWDAFLAGARDGEFSFRASPPVSG
jgi:hypothetical protein